MVEAAKHLYHRLLRKASDDMERVPPQPCKSSQAEVTRDKKRCLRHGTSKGKPSPRPEALSTKPCSPTETLVEKPCSRPETTGEVFRSLSETTIPSREPLEQVAGGDFRRQLELTAPPYRSGEWKYDFKMSKLTAKILNLLFTEAEQKGRTRDFRMYIGLGSAGSSTDKLCLDLRFSPWDIAITHRSEWHSTSKTVFTQYDPSGSRCTEQSDVWLDDVKTFYHRPIRCVAIVHQYFPAQRAPFSCVTPSACVSTAPSCGHGHQREVGVGDMARDGHLVQRAHQSNWSLVALSKLAQDGFFAVREMVYARKKMAEALAEAAVAKSA